MRKARICLRSSILRDSSASGLVFASWAGQRYPLAPLMSFDRRCAGNAPEEQVCFTAGCWPSRWVWAGGCRTWRYWFIAKSRRSRTVAFVGTFGSVLRVVGGVLSGRHQDMCTWRCTVFVPSWVRGGARQVIADVQLWLYVFRNRETIMNGAVQVVGWKSPSMWSVQG